jgi:hypothetical protein
MPNSYMTPGSIWRLQHGDEVIARLMVTGADMPWMHADVEILPGFEEFRPTFVEQEHAIDEEDWERVDACYAQIRSALTMTFPDGSPVAEFWLHIHNDGTAGWRWHDVPFDDASPICPSCGSAAIPLVRGKPGPATVAAAKAGQVALLGCRVSRSDPNWHCTAGGHRWRDADREAWRTAVESAVAGRPRCPRCTSASRKRIEARFAGDYARDIRAGHAVVVTEPNLPRGQHECLTCGYLWTPTRG